jgi:hypothetical protein
VAPQHDPGHPDLASCLGNRQQAFLLHAGKPTLLPRSVIGYHGCHSLEKNGKVETCVTTKEVPATHSPRRAAGSRPAFRTHEFQGRVKGERRWSVLAQ